MRSYWSHRLRLRPLAVSQLLPLSSLLVAAFFVPMALLLAYSFWQQDGFTVAHHFNLDSYRTALTDGLYQTLLVRSLVIGAIVATVSVALAYPFAYAATFRFPRFKNLLLVAAIVSLFTSYLVRVYAFQTILGEQGVVNWALEKAGLVSHPLSFLLFNWFAVVITLTNVFLPYVLLPIWAAMQNVNRDELEAARDLGAGPLETFVRVVVPATFGGASAGFVFAFVLASGDYVTPSLVGGATGTMIGGAISDSFGLVNDYPLGAALAFLLLASFAVALTGVRVAGALAQRARVDALARHTIYRIDRLRLPGRGLWAHAYVALVLLFLFVPIAIIIVLSFNTSPVPAFPIRGWTFHWYGRVFADPIFRGALETSVKVAAVTAIVGGLIGTLAAFPLSRPFRGRGLVTTLLVAPLAMPGLITGVAMLNFFVAQRIPLSIDTIVLGHLVYATPFVVLAMTARLADLDPALQEAGRDLGRGVVGVFRTITLPLIFPALAGAALVAAALSLDEVIITNFVSGSTVTLPLFIWAKLRIGVTPDTNAVCTLIVCALTVLVVASYVLSRLVGGRRPGTAIGGEP